MDELEISGKRYISTRRAGKEHGYHSDYIGQLIRGGKIQGQKVGRAWYVGAESLAQYLGKEYSKSAPPVVEVEPIGVADLVNEKVSIEIPPAVVGVVRVESPVMNKDQIKEKPKPVEEEQRIPIHVPLTVVAEKQEEEREESADIDEHFVKLKYIEDHEPLLPEIRSSAITSRYPESPTKTLKQKATTHPAGMRAQLAGTAILVGIGIGTVAIVSLSGAYVSSKISFVEGQTANISYAIGW